MKNFKGIMVVLCLTLVFLSAPLLFAAGEKEGKKEEVEITLIHDKGGTPNFQPYFEAVGNKTDELFGIKVTPVPYPSTDVFKV